MDLSELHIFRTVVRAGGITRAAEKLHRVQSNVTTRIRQLEEELGVQLFIREGKRLHVSPSGKILLDYADRLLALADEAREAVHDSEPRGLLKLGSMESTAAVRLPGPLSEYHCSYPEVTLELHTGNPQQLSEKILAGELDAALVADPVADVPFEKVPIYEEELVIVTVAGQKSIKPANCKTSKTALTFENGCPHRKRLEDWFAYSGEMPDRIIEMSSYHAMLGCVAAGMGLSLMPRAVIEAFPGKDRLSIHELPEGQNRAQIVLIWRKGAKSPKIEALMEIFKKNPGTLLADTRR